MKSWTTQIIRCGLTMGLLLWHLSAYVQEDWAHYDKDWDDRLFQSRVQGEYDWIGSGPDRLTKVEFTTLDLTQSAIYMYQFPTDNRDIDIFPPRDEFDPGLQYIPPPKDWEDRKNLINRLSRDSVPEPGYFEDKLDEDAGPDTYYLMGNIYYLQGNYASAITNYQRAAEEFPRFRLAFKNMAYAYSSLGDCLNALPAAQKATQLGAFTAHLKGLIAFCSLRLGQYHSAAEAAAIARILDSENQVWLELEIEALVKLGRYKHARVIVNNSLRGPEFVGKRIDYLTGISRGAGDYNSLLALLEIKKRASTISELETRELSRLKISIGIANVVDDDVVAEYLEQTSPPYTELAAILNSRLIEFDFESALEISNVLDQSISHLSPADKSDLSVTQARVLKESGSAEIALARLENVLSDFPLHCDALLLSAEILNDQEQMELATGYLRRAENSVNKCSDEIPGRQAKIMFDQGKYAQSYEVYSRESRQNTVDGLIENQWHAGMIKALADLLQLEPRP